MEDYLDALLQYGDRTISAPNSKHPSAATSDDELTCIKCRHLQCRGFNGRHDEAEVFSVNFLPIPCSIRRCCSCTLTKLCDRHAGTYQRLGRWREVRRQQQGEVIEVSQGAALPLIFSLISNRY